MANFLLNSFQKKNDQNEKNVGENIKNIAELAQ